MYSWSASRKNILHRFVVYKREAPRYFSLARIYRDSFLLVCEGSYGNRIVLYDATKDIYEYTQRRRTETLERRRMKKKKSEASPLKDEASSSSSSSSRKEGLEKEEKEKEEDEERNKNVSAWNAEELCDLDGDCGVCDEDGFDLPRPAVVTPDKKKPSVCLLCFKFSLTSQESLFFQGAYFSLSSLQGSLLSQKYIKHQRT